MQATGHAQNREVQMSAIETPDRFLREPEVRHITGLSRTTRWRLEQAGKFPKKYPISDNAKANLASEIFKWMAERVGAA